MSPIARARARDKRRYEKRQSVLAMREVEARRNKQVLGVVLAMVIVIGGLVGLSLLNKDAGTNVSAPARSQNVATTSGQPSAAAKSVAPGWVSPPQVPSDNRPGPLPRKTTAARHTCIAPAPQSAAVSTPAT